jgi:hypothetical protein
MAFETMRSIKSYAPFIFKNRTRAKFFLTGKMLTPLMDILVFLAFFNTCDQRGKSSSLFNLKTMIVICMDDNGISRSLSYS